MRDQYKCDSFLQFLIFNLQLFVKLDLYQGCHVEWRMKLLFHVVIKNKRKSKFSLYSNSFAPYQRILRQNSTWNFHGK